MLPITFISFIYNNCIVVEKGDISFHDVTFDEYGERKKFQVIAFTPF